MKSIKSLGLAGLVALSLLVGGSMAIASARAADLADLQLAGARSLENATAAITESVRVNNQVILDEIDSGKPPLSVGTPVENVIYASQQADQEQVRPDVVNQDEPIHDNPLYEDSVSASSAGADSGQQVAATATGDKPALRNGRVVEDVVFAGSSSQSALERAAIERTASVQAAQQSTTAGASDEINIWYGPFQPFGNIGKPQMQINVLGNVITPTGPISATFTLNGGAPRPLSLGPDTRRLGLEHDFNMEIPFSELVTGTNQISISATDHLSTTTTRVVGVNYIPGNVWPATYAANWNTAGLIQNVAQIVDGKWAIVGGLLRPLELNYDRLVAVGDVTWTDYEVMVPVTIHAIDDAGFRRPSNGPGVGLLLRWQGHYQQLDEQPATGWKNFGALGWFRWAQDEPGVVTAGQQMLVYDGKEVATNSVKTPSFGVPYIMKMSVQSSPPKASYYRFKVWRASEPEPIGWDMEAFGQAGEPVTGSLVLVAHHVDASFGNVTVRPLSDITPTISTGTDGNGLIVLSPDKETYRYGERVEVIAAGNSGFAFNEWHSDVQGTENPLVLYPTDDISLTATFVIPKPSVISATVQGEGSIKLTPEKSTYSYDELVSFTAIPNPQHAFVGWRGAFSGSSNPISVKIRDDLNVEAVFAETVAPPVSDDFRTCKLDSIWTARDPKGDSTIAVNGQQLVISVPANSDHDLFENKNFAPRILQPTPNQDFAVEAKFESRVSQRFHLQGIIVEQDTDNFLRLEFFHDGTSTHIFAAYMKDGKLTSDSNTIITVPDGSATYMRVSRSGNTWTQEYSFDGLNWVQNAQFDHVLTVVSSGVYGGNVDPDKNDEVDTSPAYTAIVDYFFNTAARIDPEDGGSLTLTTNVVGQGSVAKNPDLATYTCTENIRLTATPAEGSVFAGWSGDITSANNPLDMTLAQGDTLTATFTEIITGGIKVFLPIVAR